MDAIHIYITIGALTLIILILARLVFLAWLRKRKSLKKMKVGKKMESKAKKIISHAGFKKVKYQENFFYHLRVNGDRVKVACIPDFVAEKSGKKCVIEVKWGASAPLISNSATRRQLLEYQHAIQPDKLFLLDMRVKSLKEITF